MKERSRMTVVKDGKEVTLRPAKNNTSDLILDIYKSLVDKGKSPEEAKQIINEHCYVWGGKVGFPLPVDQMAKVHKKLTKSIVGAGGALVEVS